MSHSFFGAQGFERNNKPRKAILEADQVSALHELGLLSGGSSGKRGKSVNRDYSAQAGLPEPGFRKSTYEIYSNISFMECFPLHIRKVFILDLHTALLQINPLPQALRTCSIANLQHRRGPLIRSLQLYPASSSSVQEVECQECWMYRGVVRAEREHSLVASAPSARNP